MGSSFPPPPPPVLHYVINTCIFTCTLVCINHMHLYLNYTIQHCHARNYPDSMYLLLAATLINFINLVLKMLPNDKQPRLSYLDTFVCHLKLSLAFGKTGAYFVL